MRYLHETEKNLLEDLLFDSMSAYRLAKVELDDLERNQAKTNENKTKIENLKSATLIWLNFCIILHNLNCVGQISEEDFLKLKKFSSYADLVSKLSENPPESPVATITPDQKILNQTDLAQPELYSQIESILEKEFEKKAIDDIEYYKTKDKYLFIRMLNRIGWLGELNNPKQKFTNACYRGELITKISFEELRTDYNKNMVLYTSHFNIRKAVLFLFNMHETNKGINKDKIKQLNAFRSNTFDLTLFSSGAVNSATTLETKIDSSLAYQPGGL